jgi:uncharacterized membrane protein YsdA (DUF1294 family)/cold shock CspA family protein
MRFDGRIKTWTDDRGFGFIEPSQGGQDIFLHVKAIKDRSGRPQIGQAVTFEVELNHDGKKRAKNVQVVRAARIASRDRRDSPAQWGTASFFAIPAFMVVYLLVAVSWRVPAWVAALYVAGSIVCFAFYAVDKSAAVAGRWRVSEGTLILLGLACGWPGAIVAQQVLRHKSNKAQFRSAFWGSVVLNVLAFLALTTPLVSRLQA